MRGAQQLAMRGAALRAMPSAVPRLQRSCVALVSPRLLRQPLAARAPRSVVWPGEVRHVHTGRVLRASDTGNGPPVAGDESDVRADEAAALIDALAAMLAEEEELDARERAALEQALEEARAGRVRQALQVLDAADAIGRESMSSPSSSKLPEEMAPEEAAYACRSAPVLMLSVPSVETRNLTCFATYARRDFVREVQRQTATVAAPQRPVTADEARALFDNLAKQLDEPIDYEAVRERNLRRLSREQRLIDSDIDAVARWVDAHEEEVCMRAARSFGWALTPCASTCLGRSTGLQTMRNS